MKGRRQIQTHFQELWVKKLPICSGSDEFDTRGLEPDTEYRVLATYVKLSGISGLATPVFLIEGPGGAIVEKACSRFCVVEAS